MMVAVQYWSLVVTVMEAARTELVATCTGQELLRFLDGLDLKYRSPRMH